MLPSKAFSSPSKAFSSPQKQAQAVQQPHRTPAKHREQAESLKHGSVATTSRRTVGANATLLAAQAPSSSLPAQQQQQIVETPNVLLPPAPNSIVELTPSTYQVSKGGVSFFLKAVSLLVHGSWDQLAH